MCQMNIKTNNQVVFYSIQGSTIKKFLLLDFILGTGIYYLVKIISSSILIGSIGSFICTEGIKSYQANACVEKDVKVLLNKTRK